MLIFFIISQPPNNYFLQLEANTKLHRFDKTIFILGHKYNRNFDWSIIIVPSAYLYSKWGNMFETDWWSQYYWARIWTITRRVSNLSFKKEKLVRIRKPTIEKWQKFVNRCTKRIMPVENLKIPSKLRWIYSYLFLLIYLHL